MSNNNDYTTGNLSDFAYFKRHYKVIAIYSSKQTKLKDPQQINFIGRLLNTRGATMFFIIEKIIIININNGNTKDCKFIKWYIIDSKSKGN